MKAFLCYPKPGDSFIMDGMWLTDQPLPVHEEIGSIEVEVPKETFNKVWEDLMEPVELEAVFRRLWEQAGLMLGN